MNFAPRIEFPGGRHRRHKGFAVTQTGLHVDRISSTRHKKQIVTSWELKIIRFVLYLGDTASKTEGL